MGNSRPSITGTVREDNAVTIPSKFREKHGIEPGDDVQIELIESSEADAVSEKKFEELKKQAEELFG